MHRTSSKSHLFPHSKEILGYLKKSYMQRDINEELSNLHDEERVWNVENCQRLQWVSREVKSGNTATVTQYVSRLQGELVEMRITNQKLMMALHLRAQTIESLQKDRTSGTQSVEMQCPRLA